MLLYYLVLHFILLTCFGAVKCIIISVLSSRNLIQRMLLELFAIIVFENLNNNVFMNVFNSKYELITITIKEDQFHDTYKTFLFS
jgi:hypothetical protein